MRFDEAMVDGFFDELSNIQKEAGFWSAAGKGISGAFSQAGQGARTFMGAAKGPASMIPGVKSRLMMGGLKQMAPAAAIVGTGGLATYGAGKAAFGN